MDKETQLYYLQSRYYNPEIGRFLNADSFVSTGQGILGYNIFAYCGNNPVLYTDSTGTRHEISAGGFGGGGSDRGHSANFLT
ncbi:MAG: RHS repeat-associated core domain-containing protein [Oscillospiraceae bacterium]|nr:RHS repeat-associated core domain-containing protein [Oscillospiraceae bacterium]